MSSFKKRTEIFTRFLCLSSPEHPESEFDVYYFKAALRLHLSNQNSETAEDMMQNLYADNVISGCATEESVVQYFTRARAYMSEANFNLRSWA